MDQELIVCFQIFAPTTSDIFQNYAGSILVTSLLEGTDDIPSTCTISRHVSLILMKGPEGSLHLGRCHITYHLSYLTRGKLQFQSGDPSPCHPTPCHQCPRLLSPESHSVPDVMHMQSHIFINNAWSHHK